jgi:hypothetical protein
MNDKTIRPTRAGGLTKQVRGRNKATNVAVTAWSTSARQLTGQKFHARASPLEAALIDLVITDGDDMMPLTRPRARPVSPPSLGWWNRAAVLCRATVNDLMPIAYEDETGFHFGEP